MRIRFIRLLAALIPATIYGAPTPAVVVAPVVDLWSHPSDDPADLTDDKRETQLLHGERVIVHESSGNWIRVEAVEQPEFTHNKL